MITTNQFKNGMSIILGSEVYTIINFQHVKPGKGAAFVRTKLKNLKTGNFIDRTFRAGERLEQAFLEEKKVQFLYRQGKFYHFLDQSSFEEIELAEERIADKLKFLKENMVLSIVMCRGEIVDIKLPNFVELKITHTEPGLRADTVKAATKQAQLETGARIDVPLFLNPGDIIKIDTRTGEYVSRV